MTRTKFNEIHQGQEVAFKNALSESNRSKLLTIANQIITSFVSKKGIAFFGNGGSAAEAMHLAAEFTGKCVRDHEPWFAISLGDSQSALTAITNDFGSEYVFARPIEAMKSNLGLVVGLSTSGKSKNVLEGLKKAKNLGMVTVLMTGNSIDYLELPYVDYMLNVESSLTPRIQEVHLLWGHTLAELVEEIFI